MNEDSIHLSDIADKLSSICWDILNMLSQREYLTYTEIKNSLKLSQEKSSKEIARLEGALLVDSKRDNVDERVRKFYLTIHGTNIIKFKTRREG